MIKEADINSEIREAYAKNRLTITLFPDRTTKEFVGLSALYNFFEIEVAFWNSVVESNRPARIQAIRNQVMSVLRNIQNVINSNSITLQNNIQTLRQTLFQSYDSKIIYSKSKAVKPIPEMCASGRYNEAFINNYILFLQNGGFTDNNLQGQIAAYLALNPFTDPSQNLEIKNFLDETITNTQGMIEKAEKEQAEYWDTVKEDYEKVTTEIKSEYEKFFDQRQQEQDEQSNSWSENLKEAKDRMAELENLYQEKLRLQAPAKYWEELEAEYIKKGKIWVGWAVSSTVVLGVALVIILYFIPDTLKGSLTDIGSGTIRSTLILAAAVSMCVYVIRLFVKLATSSFHLARDAKERYTLANLYLSLTEKDAIEKDSRDIILNALFSRADSGLLKGDSSPSFPIEGLTSVISKGLKQ